MLYKNSKFVIELEPKHFNKNSPDKLRKHGCSLVMFYANWCPHCVNMVETWNNLARLASFVDICAFDCAEYQDHFDKIKEAAPKLIYQFPTIVIYEGGNYVEEVRLGPGSKREELLELLKYAMDVCSRTKNKRS